MTRSRTLALAAAVAFGAMTVTACGSTSPTTGTSVAPINLDCPEGKLVGEGSSAQKTAIQEIIASYGDACKNKATIEYNATGSGAGIKQFNAGLVDFGGSDSALKEAEATAANQRCNSNPAWNLPLVVGPIAFTYNLDGVDKLVLTPQVLASIFQGKITTWNDPQIAALNNGVTLPSTPIAIFYRAGESGTTENVSKYLKANAPDIWTADTSKSWKGVGGEGKNLTSDVADAVAGTKGSLGYVEWGAALDSDLNVAWIDNGSGPVELTIESAGKAVEAAKPAGEGNDLKLSIDYATKAEGAYPAILITYEIVCSAGLDATKTELLKDFLTFYATDGQEQMADLGYAPLPESVKTKVETAIKAIA